MKNKQTYIENQKDLEKIFRFVMKAIQRNLEEMLPGVDFVLILNPENKQSIVIGSNHKTNEEAKYYLQKACDALKNNDMMPAGSIGGIQ